jgi:DNA-binding NarL/FixJ family response regulator
MGLVPHVGILCCTMNEDGEFVFAGLKAGGRGCVLKESDPDTVLRAIRVVRDLCLPPDRHSHPRRRAGQPVAPVLPPVRGKDAGYSASVAGLAQLT